MGLRIIDRRKAKGPPEISDAEVLANLAAGSERWAAAWDAEQIANQRHFLDQIRTVRARFVTPAEVAAGAQRIIDGLGERGKGAAVLHHQVDVATLLELL